MTNVSTSGALEGITRMGGNASGCSIHWCDGNHDRRPDDNGVIFHLGSVDLIPDGRGGVLEVTVELVEPADGQAPATPEVVIRCEDVVTVGSALTARGLAHMLLAAADDLDGANAA